MPRARARATICSKRDRIGRSTTDWAPSGALLFAVTGSERALGLAPGEVRHALDHADWSAAFAGEMRRIGGVFLPPLLYVGSTAVPGLPAKPILDMLALAPFAEQDDVTARLTQLGYVDRGRRPGGGGRLLVRLRDGLRAHNLHLYDPSAAEVEDQRDFVAALHASREARRRYADRKIVLAAEPAVDRCAYTDGKGATVAAILADWRAGRHGS